MSFVLHRWNLSFWYLKIVKNWGNWKNSLYHPAGSTWSRWISRLKECLSMSWWNTIKTSVKISLNIHSINSKIHVEERGINSKYRKYHIKIYQAWVCTILFYSRSIACKLGELPSCLFSRQPDQASHRLTMQFGNNMDIIFRKRLRILIIISGYIWVWIVFFLFFYYFFPPDPFFVLWCFCFHRFNVRQNRNIKEKTQTHYHFFCIKRIIVI